MIFLETERLRIRNVRATDATEVFDYRNNEKCAKYQRGQIKDYDGIVSLMGRRGNDTLTVNAPSMLAVAKKETDTIIGEIVVMLNEGTISLGYTFSYKVHRNGFAYEALSALLNYLHGNYPEWDFICFTETENVPSIALLKKLGYSDCGYLPSKDSQVFGKWLRPDTIEEILHAVQ